MKKFVSFLLIIVFVLAGCNQQQVVTPAPVIERTAQIEQPTKPSVIITEEHIEETAVPTEEPTEIPTPTEELEICPEAFVLPDDLSIDLGEYGTFHIYPDLDIPTVSVGTNWDVITDGEKDVTAVRADGGTLSFKINSRGWIYFNNEGVNIESEQGVKVSENVYLVTAPTEVSISIESGVIPEYYPLFYIEYEQGSQPVFDDSTVNVEGGIWKQHCVDNHYVIEIEGEEVEISSKYPLLFAEVENIESVVMHIPAENRDLEMTDNFANILLHPGSSITVKFRGGYGKFTVIPMNTVTN